MAIPIPSTKQSLIFTPIMPIFSETEHSHISRRSTMASFSSVLGFFFTFLLCLTQIQGGELLFEDGYTVSTVLDGNKVKVSPYSLAAQSPPSDLIVLLDYTASTFYTLSFPTDKEGVIERLAGTGSAGYADGALDLAMFNKPKSFAIDYQGNVYVADKANLAIRKITKTGVTTIAGGYSQKPGRADGPGRNASFSNDFELAFVPERCALMISDHSNKLVRQVKLKVEDCARHSDKKFFGTTSSWLLGLGFSCLFGLIVGFIIRPFVLPHEAIEPIRRNETWTQCLMSLERQIVILCSDIRSAIVRSALYSLSRRLIMLSLSHIFLMFRLNLYEPKTSHDKPISLLDSDELSSSRMSKSAMVLDQLKDLISFDGDLVPSENANEIVKREKGESPKSSSCSHSKMDTLILANFMSFADQVPRVSSAEYRESCSGLVRRR